MCLKKLSVAVLLLCAANVCLAGTVYVVPTTTLTALTTNNTSAAASFAKQSNGNAGAGNVSKVNVHSLLYAGATTKVVAHLMLWFGPSNHMNVGYTSNDANQIHKQITDMISRGIDGVIIDWYGPNNSIDQATQLVMAEAETHPGFTFAIMIDQGAIQYDSCSGCNPQQALVTQLQYIEQKYFPSPAYMTQQGHPVVTNFNIDLSYTINWKAAAAALSTQPVFIFQNNTGFTHVLSGGSYSWVMPTTTDYGMGYLSSFYVTGIPLVSEQTVGAGYKGFNDTLAAWGSGRIMSQQCGQTWVNTFSKVNGLYNSGMQLPMLQLVTWNDYEEGTEIETGTSNCLTISAAVSGNGLTWSIHGQSNTLDHYTTYISTDGQNLMSLGDSAVGTNALNLCSYPIPNGKYTLYVRAVGKPSMSNQISGPVAYTSTCGGSKATLNLGTNPSTMSLVAGGSGQITVTATPQAGTFDSAIQLSCSGLPANLSCGFAPASVIPGNSGGSSVLTIRDAGAEVGAAYPRGEGARRSTIRAAFWLLSAGMSGLVFIGPMFARRKRVLRTLARGTLAGLILVLLLVCASCGGNALRQSTGSGQAPVTYPVTIHGSGDAQQLTTMITVSVT